MVESEVPESGWMSLDLDLDRVLPELPKPPSASASARRPRRASLKKGAKPLRSKPALVSPLKRPPDPGLTATRADGGAPPASSPPGPMRERPSDTAPPLAAAYERMPGGPAAPQARPEPRPRRIPDSDIIVIGRIKPTGPGQPAAGH